MGAASAYLCFLIQMSMMPPGPFSRVQLCSVVLQYLNSTWPEASAEDVHGTIFLLVLLYPYEESTRSEVNLL